MTGELSPALQLKDFQARLTLNGFSGADRDILDRVGDDGCSSIRAFPLLVVASGMDFNPACLNESLDNLVAVFHRNFYTHDAH